MNERDTVHKVRTNREQTLNLYHSDFDNGNNNNNIIQNIKGPCVDGEKTNIKAIKHATKAERWKFICFIFY